MIDFKKDPIYKAGAEPAIIDVPLMKFVTFEGEGAPESSDGPSPKFQEAIQALYGIVFTIKFWDKKHAPPEGYDKFSLTPLEALWWMKGHKVFDMSTPGDWRWKLMIRLPDFVGHDFFEEVVDELVTKKQPNSYRHARLEDFQEGPSVQLMHIGPYDQERADIEKMHEFARQAGYVLHGAHHELYFSDPRRAKPEKLRTILRQPVRSRG